MFLNPNRAHKRAHKRARATVGLKRFTLTFTRRFTQRDEGMAAIEFAMIAPLLLVMFLGTVEFGQAITLDRRVTIVASATADLVAQSEAVCSETLDEVLTLGEELVRPALVNYYDDNELKITLIAVQHEKDVNGTDKIKVKWSWDRSHGPAPGYAVDSDFDEIPMNVIQENSHLIVAKVEYKYVPDVWFFIGADGVDLEETFYLAPRNGETKFEADCANL